MVYNGLSLTRHTYLVGKYFHEKGQYFFCSKCQMLFEIEEKIRIILEKQNNRTLTYIMWFVS